MADTKISALPTSTLPLAGTEVLPIVQSSSTKQVSVDDLTVKNVRSNATNGILQIAGPAAAATRVMTTPDANFTAARTDAAQSFTGDQTLSTGNLVIGTAGKGIDFTQDPNPAGMTSELLADYEEGTWTPNEGAGLTVVGAFSSVGRYIKIGNMVTVWGQVTGATSIAVSAIGLITTNLPFALQTDVGAMGIAAGFWTSMNSAIHISAGATTSIYAVQAVSGSTSIGFTISYRV
jgi:hypothetical protein